MQKTLVIQNTCNTNNLLTKKWRSVDQPTNIITASLDHLSQLEANLTAKKVLHLSIWHPMQAHLFVQMLWEIEHHALGIRQAFGPRHVRSPLWATSSKPSL